MTFDNTDRAQLNDFNGAMADLARQLDNALAAACDIRDRTAAAASRGYRDDDDVFLSRQWRMLATVLGSLPAAHGGSNLGNIAGLAIHGTRTVDEQR